MIILKDYIVLSVDKIEIAPHYLLNEMIQWYNISIKNIDMNSILYTLFVHDATIEEENDTANYVVREYI